MTLFQLLKDRIRQYGPMDIGQFMSLALGHREFGYYMKKDPFGREGDFTTAPEISQMFGEILGAWAADVWMKMGSPPAFTFLECGPGRGTLMADMMRAAKGVPGFHAAAKIHLLEMSPVLKEMQRSALKDYQVTWHEKLETLPMDQPIIVIANEFLDALPTRQFQKTKNGWMERVVALKDKEFVFALIPNAPPLTPPHAGGSEARGGAFEIAPARMGFVKKLCAVMKQAGGAALIIDYGHIKSGYGDTLQAVYKHQYCGVLEHIGEADLTSHVDFELLAVEDKMDGADVYGPVEQGAFLKALGIEARARALMNKANDEQSYDIQKALHRLTASDQMGSLFKVMGFSCGLNVPLAGF